MAHHSLDVTNPSVEAVPKLVQLASGDPIVDVVLRARAAAVTALEELAVVDVRAPMLLRWPLTHACMHGCAGSKQS